MLFGPSECNFLEKIGNRAKAANMFAGTIGGDCAVLDRIKPG
jgi:hypothetical protein